MPEKPKRRKNKNRRKNNKNTVPNSNIDVNKNNIDESDTTISESCSSVKEESEEKNDISVISDVNSIETDICQNVEQVIEEKEFLSTTSQIETIRENKTKPTNINFPKESPILVNSEKLNKEACTLDISPDLSKILVDQSKEKENYKLGSSEECLLSKQSIHIENITEEISQTYIVETPEQVTKTKCKLDSGMKSKSCDNDDCPTIVEITDDCNMQSGNDNFPIIDNSNVIVSEESDIEWEKVDHFNLPQTELIKGILSSDTIPLNIIHCEQIKSLSPQDELSLRNYLQTLNLSTNPSNFDSADIKTEIEQIINREIKYRLRKKGLTDDNLLHRAGPSRSLAVIDEEGSGDSSKTSRRHSYLSDKKSDNEELEDDVFESKQTHSTRCCNLDYKTNNSSKRLIPQPCIRVDAKLREPEISEARGDWSVKTVEKITGVELVYLTDSSSSTSSIYDINDDEDKGEETDVSVRMITPTIEVTDTESLLSNTFLSIDNNKDLSDSPCIKSTCEAINETLTDNITLTKEIDNNEINNPTLQQDSHEIVILSTDDIKTNLFVKDANESKFASEIQQLCEDNMNFGNIENKTPDTLSKPPKDVDVYDLEIKVLKCELNDAINNLIKEVISDSESNKESTKDTFTRQDSSSSLDSSQCTAKYNPTSSSLNDVSNILQDDPYDNTSKESLQKNTISHVKEVLQCVSSKPPVMARKMDDEHFKQPFKLRDICLKKISCFPYGDKILEELAHVSLRLQNMSALASECKQIVKNQTTVSGSQKDTDQLELNESLNYKSLYQNDSSNAPPPVLPRKSSLKKALDDSIKFVAPKSDAVYECLSPSQKMLMEKTNTTITRDFISQPDVNSIHNDTSNYKEKSLHRLNSSPSIAPLKSETGSRLLALLQDTSISQNLNTHSLEKNTVHLTSKMKPPYSDKFSKHLLDEIDATKKFGETADIKKSFLTSSSNICKPLPPPKPKKISTYFYESDGSSDFRENSFRTMHSNKKYFHYSTGNLSKEIENDISSIQNMHRYCTNLRDQGYEHSPRRPSLPKDLCDQQMEYIRQKEKEVDAELRRLEQEKYKPNISRGPRAPMVSEEEKKCHQIFDSQNNSYINKEFTTTSYTSKNVDNSKLCSLFSRSQEELLREKMYTEYVSQMAEREQRKHQKVIKVTQKPANTSTVSKSMPLLHNFDSKMNNRIEEEFISKARERWCKLGIRDPETEDEKDINSDLYREPKVTEHKIKVFEAGEEKDVKKLPRHMQEFVKFTVKDKDEEIGSNGESDSEKASSHVVVLCAVVILVLTVGKFLLQFLRFK